MPIKLATATAALALLGLLFVAATTSVLTHTLAAPAPWPTPPTPPAPSAPSTPRTPPAEQTPPSSQGLDPTCATTAGPTRTLPGYTAEQMTNAATIVAVGQKMNVPPQGWIIAVTAALQESGLRNLNHGDRDSLGLFQQRPSQGWGTPTQILNPTYAATQFYRHLLALPNWQHMTVNDAAQAVQRSATPSAYSRHEPGARALVNTVGSGIRRQFRKIMSSPGALAHRSGPDTRRCPGSDDRDQTHARKLGRYEIPASGSNRSSVVKITASPEKASLLATDRFRRVCPVR